MRISITIFVLIANISFNGVFSKKVKNYYGNAIRDPRGFRKPLASPLGNSISDSLKRYKREEPKGLQAFQNMLDKAKIECIHELQMDRNLMQKSLKGEENPTTNEKCLILCILQKTKLMEDNNISLNTIGRIAGMVSMENPWVIAVTVSKANNCNNMIRVPNELACEKAYHIHKCLTNELKPQKLNFFY